MNTIDNTISISEAKVQTIQKFQDNETLYIDACLTGMGVYGVIKCIQPPYFVGIMYQSLQMVCRVKISLYRVSSSLFLQILMIHIRLRGIWHTTLQILNLLALIDLLCASTGLISTWQWQKIIQSTGLPTYRAARIPVSSSLNISAWEAYLLDYPDKRVIQYLNFGFPLSLSENNNLQNTDVANHVSALQYSRLS